PKSERVPLRPPLAISGRIRRRVRGVLSSIWTCPHGQAYNSGQLQAGPQSKRVDEVVTRISGRGAKDRPLFAVGQGRGGTVRHRDFRGASTGCRLWWGSQDQSALREKE